VTARHANCFLVIGAKGMLGTDLAQLLRQEVGDETVIGVDLPEIDITDEGSVRAWLDRCKPRVILNCAAFTNVDACEDQQDTAFAVNAHGAGNLARAACEHEARFIHVSTDFVFDGRKREPYVETDSPSPLGVYGASKLEGERQVEAAGGDYAIARTAWLYGAHGKNFVDTILRLARDRDELRVVTDQTGSPTWTCDLARALLALARSACRGLFHTVNPGACSRFELTQEALRFAGLKTPVVPITSDAFPRKAQVPASSVLSTDKFSRETGMRMRPWEEALREYIVERAALVDDA